MLLSMDKFKGPTGFNSLLREGSVGDRIAAVERLERLSAQVRRALTSDWADSVRVGAMQQGTLSLVIDDRAHLLEARFLNDQLINALSENSDFPGLKRIKWNLSRTWDKPKHSLERLQSPEPVDIEGFLERALQRSKDG